MSSPANQAPPAQPSIGRSAFLVAAAIFLTRIFGLVRERVFAHYFGLSDVADAFRAAMRIPNTLQNLLGEGALSASFIPVYARLTAQGEKAEAGRVAGAIFSILALVTSVLVLLGVFAAPLLVDAIAPGFADSRRPLAIQLVRVFFPGMGFLVLSAWCLGILNSHGRFFLSYISPVVWNVAMIVALVAFGRGAELSRLAYDTAWASVIGSALQFLVQLPVVIRLAPALRLGLQAASDNVRTVIRNFGPVFVSRGVTQLSAYVDSIFATKIGVGALAALTNAQLISVLPISLFGMSVSVAELPAMASEVGSQQEVADALHRRIAVSTRRIGFFVVPSAIAFLALGDVIAAGIFQTGRFHHADALRVWGILAGSAVGLVAATVGRLYSSAYYALRDTRTPLRYAIIRVILTTILGYLFALPLPRLIGHPDWGTAGLTASYGISAWVEFLLLRRGMAQRIGAIDSERAYFAKLWLSAIVAAAVAWGIKLLLPPLRPEIAAILILVPYGVTYLALTILMGVEQAGSLAKRLGQSLGISKSP
jgi:putative peptidoglycan lipid II flippase